MRLISLEMQGFKSFPDRTKLNFDTGMTVVIGPNGSGKSNISDAIRWVLGEISSKSIRGTKMEDVIFGGTDNRRPMGYAEVSLTFDNTEGEIALPVEYDEVTVTRKYYRSGDSEYMINGKNVRLRDITELFMNTGIGKSGYSVIGQGRIAEIISKKSEDRRGIFEEAAGISKYRYKKSEAERKLEKTDDNLSRVTDILTELGTRVGPLEKEAEKARKYLEIYAEKKEVDVGLWLYEIDSVRDRSQALNERFEITKHELQIAEDSLASLDRQTDLLFERIKENNEKSENAHKESLRLNEEKHRASSATQLLLRDSEHHRAEEIRISSEIEKKTAEGEAELTAMSDAENAKELCKKKIAALEKDLSDNQEKIEETRGSIASLAVERDKADENVETAKGDLQDLRLELSKLEGSKTGENERREDLQKQLSELTDQIAKKGEELLSSQQALADYQQKQRDQKDQIERLDAQIKKDEESVKELREKENARQVVLNTLDERIKLLRRMEEHFEGYSGSVRHIMNKASAGELTGICGPVSKLLHVKEEYALAFETTLGASLQHIVTVDDISAKRAIEELKKSGNGRATFYPLNTIVPQELEIDVEKLRRMHGYIGKANELAEFDEKYADVMNYLLCRTVICETLDDAADISKAFSYKFKTVSLDGQVVNAGGSFTGGSSRRESGILSRGAEISRLEKEKAEKEKELSETKKEIAALQSSIDERISQRELEKQTSDILQMLCAGSDTDFKVRKASLDADNAQRASLEESLQLLQDEMNSFNSRKASLETAIADAVSIVAARQVEADKLSARQASVEEERSALIEKKNSLLFEKGSLEKDLAMIGRQIEASLQKIAGLQNDVETLKNEKEELRRKEELCKKKRIEQEALEKELSAKLKELESADGDLRAENEEYEKQSAEIRLKQKEKNAHREILLKDYTKLEGALEAIKSEQERFASKLWDEYELTYAASKELGVPVVTAETRAENISKQNKLKSRIRELGSVNVGAIEEYAEVKERYDSLSKQYEDLTTSRSELNSVISSLEKDMKERFATVFSQINDNFRVVFKELFGGGTAELSLSDPENILESGIEISVAPPGKIIKSLSLLSGGEQVFVAIAIFFAILRVNPAPFCLLDEIEAALDEVNVARFASYAKAYSSKTQFIIITHRRGTMEEADRMYGVTMSERGISKVLPLRFDEVEEKTGIKF